MVAHGPFPEQDKGRRPCVIAIPGCKTGERMPYLDTCSQTEAEGSTPSSNFLSRRKDPLTALCTIAAKGTVVSFNDYCQSGRWVASVLG
jgi:hypothetical protein